MTLNLDHLLRHAPRAPRSPQKAAADRRLWIQVWEAAAAAIDGNDPDGLTPAPHPAQQFLAFLRKDPGQTCCRTFYGKRGDGRRRPRRGTDLHGLDVEKLQAENEQGLAVYAVIGNADQATGRNKKTGKPTGAVIDADIISCPAIFTEYDDKPKDWQRDAWREQGLPEPTLQLDSGGASIHSYWQLDEPVPREQWRELQRRLIAHTGCDESIKNTSRVMRLPGFRHVNKETGELGEVAHLITVSTRSYSVAELETCLPMEQQETPLEQLQEPLRQPLEAAVPITLPSTGDLPPRRLEVVRAALQHIPPRSEIPGTRDDTCEASLGYIHAVAEADPPLSYAEALNDLRQHHRRWHDIDDDLGRWDLSRFTAGSFWHHVVANGGSAARPGLPRRTTAPPAAGQQQQAAADGQRVPTPFSILGWNPDRNRIWYRINETGHVAHMPPPGNRPALLSLAGLEHWAGHYQSQKAAFALEPAVCSVIAAADTAGVFDPSRRRGRGVWLDDGTLIWHRGAQLSINGAEPIPLAAAPAGDFIYDARPRLSTDGCEEPLDDATGRRIFSVIRRMGWHGPSDHAYIAGAVVLGPVCGALDRRPTVVITAHFGAGKSEALLTICNLWGGPTYCLSRSAPTAAFIRQRLENDALPVLADEWEKVQGRSQDQLLELLRATYDGAATGRGTTHGQALDYSCRFLPVLAGINTSLSNPANRSRAVFVRKRRIPSDDFQALQEEMAGLITPKAGRRIIARTVSNFPTLQHNIRVLRAAIIRRLDGTNADRLADVYSHLLAGALLLIRTDRIDSEALADRWLEEIRWQPDADSAAELTPDAEGHQVLDHILSHRERWSAIDNPSGEVTLRELVDIAAGRGTPPGIDPHKALETSLDTAIEREWRTNAKRVLGRNGLKVEDGWLHIANAGAGIDSILARTKWADGSHRQRLAELPDAELMGRTTWFSAGGAQRAVRLPLPGPAGGGGADRHDRQGHRHAENSHGY